MSNDNTNSDRPWWSYLARIFRFPARTANPAKGQSDPQFMHSIVRLEGMESLQQIQGDTQQLHQGLVALKHELVEMRGALSNLDTRLETVRDAATRMASVESNILGMQQELQDFHRAYDMAQRKHREDLGRLEETVRAFSQTVLWGLLILGGVGIGMSVWLALR